MKINNNATFKYQSFKALKEFSPHSRYQTEAYKKSDDKNLIKTLSLLNSDDATDEFEFYSGGMDDYGIKTDAATFELIRCTRVAPEVTQTPHVQYPPILKIFPKKQIEAAKKMIEQLEFENQFEDDSVEKRMRNTVINRLKKFTIMNS